MDAVTVVRHTIADAAARPLSPRSLAVAVPGGAWNAATRTRVERRAQVTTDTTGTLSVDLTPNDLLDPVGTHYELTDADGAVLSFVVPTPGGEPHVDPATGQPFWWLRELLVQNPAAPSPVLAGLPAVASTATRPPGASTVMFLGGDANTPPATAQPGDLWIHP